MFDGTGGVWGWNSLGGVLAWVALYYLSMGAFRVAFNCMALRCCGGVRTFPVYRSRGVAFPVVARCVAVPVVTLKVLTFPVACVALNVESRRFLPTITRWRGGV